MCCGEFIAKYILFIVNFVVSLVGIAIIGLGIACLVWLKDISDILPLDIISISLLVLGIIIFLVAFLACCGAIRESQCMLVSYVVAVSILAALKIWLSVVIFDGLNDIQDTVKEWLESAFNDDTLRQAFQFMEHSFACCGTTGANSYTAISQPIPYTCCNTLWSDNPEDLAVCTTNNSFGGCGVIVTDWFETFGGAIGFVLLVMIAVEVTAIVLACFYCHSVKQKRSKTY